MIEVPHEKLALGVAHGYAKATGEPMARRAARPGRPAARHDGRLLLLHRPRPGDHPRRLRPGGPRAAPAQHRLDPRGQRPGPGGAAVHQVGPRAPRRSPRCRPCSAGPTGSPIEEPRGPVYVALDAAPAGVTASRRRCRSTTSPASPPPPSLLAPEPAALAELARELCAAERPVMVLGYAGRDPASFDVLVELAETVGIGVDRDALAAELPQPAPAQRDRLRRARGRRLRAVRRRQGHGQADPEAGLDHPHHHLAGSPTAPCVLDLGFGDIGISSWSEDYAEAAAGRPPGHRRHRRRPAAAAGGVPAAGRRGRPGARRGARGLARPTSPRRHDDVWRAGRPRRPQVADQSPVVAPPGWPPRCGRSSRSTTGSSPPARRPSGRCAPGTSTRPHRHPGKQLGTATQIGISLGVALAHKGTGRLVVDLQPDGDLMFDVGALWVASRYELPLLTVMFNNRAYYNDWEHQERLARQRGTPVERAHIGMAIDDPGAGLRRDREGLRLVGRGPDHRPGAGAGRGAAGRRPRAHAPASRPWSTSSASPSRAPAGPGRHLLGTPPEMPAGARPWDEVC